MQLLSTGKLKCKTGHLNIKLVSNTTHICVITEDENSGFVLCYNVLTRGMPNVDFHFYSSNGNKNIENLVKSNLFNYDKFIIISDNKQSDTIYLQMLAQIKTTLSYASKQAAYFTPTSIEEVLLSWKQLPVSKHTSLSLEIQRYFLTGIIPYIQNGSGSGGYTRISNNYIGNNLEVDLFNELSTILIYTYTKGYVQRCLYDNCCNYAYTPKIDMVSKCGYKSNINKIDALKNNSLFGGLCNCVYLLFGKQEEYLKHWTFIQKESLYKY